MDQWTSVDPIDRGRFPVDPWILRETRYDARDLGLTETLFAVGNGYLGMRGNVEEGRDAYAHGTFINGFHEVWPIHHAEEAYGFAKVGQTIINAPDAKIMRLYVDDEPLLLTVADLEHYERSLSFADGVLTRELIWRTPSGKRVHLRSRRMVTLRRAPPGGDGLRDHHARRSCAGRGELPAPQPAGRRGRAPRQVSGDGCGDGPASRCETPGPDPAARVQVGRRWAFGALLPRDRVPHDAGRRRRPHHRDQRRQRGAHPDRGRPRQARVPDPGDPWCHDPDHQDRQLPHLPRRAAPGTCRPLPAHARPGEGDRRRRRSSRSSGRGSTTSGNAATSRSAGSRLCSRPCGGTSSS